MYHFNKKHIINKVDYNNSYMYVCDMNNSIHINSYLLCMIKVRVRWCSCSLWRMLQPWGKLIGQLFCSLPLSILFLKTPKIQGMNSLAL